MSEKLEAVLQQMAELTETVKEHKEDQATLDFEQVKAEFEEQIEAMVEEQVKEKLASQPVYRVPGEAVGPDGEEEALKGNRYGYIIKEIREDGYHRVGSARMKAIDFWMAHNLLTKAAGLMPDRIQEPSDDLKAAMKALTSTGSGTGDELVPTGMAAQLWQDFFLASRLVQNMTTIPMPTNPFDVPLGLGDVTWYKGSENTATTASDPATAKSTLTATELVTEQNWSYTLDEDAVVAMMPAIRERLAISGAEIIDDFALNADSTDADTGNINSDDANPADTSYYLSAGQDGIRHLWLVDNTSQGVNASGDALADADVTAMLVLLGKYAVNPEQCFMITDAATYLKGFLNLDGVLTIDKFGEKAVLLTGQLAAYRGIPLIVSASAPKTEADGKEAINTALKLTPSIKGVVVVDQDVDIEALEDVEWAIATRFQPDRDLVVISNVPGFGLDPSAREGMTSKWGIDATKPLEELERFEKLRVPEEVSTKVKQIISRLGK